MSVVGEVYNREINGEIRAVEAVTAYMGIYNNPVNRLWYAVDWSHKLRATFKTPETARKWCRDVFIAYAGIPQTNMQVERFNCSGSYETVQNSVSV